MPARPRAVAFDIIETVFSLEPVRKRLVALGLPPGSLEAWFAAGLRDAFALAATSAYAPFRSVLEGALDDLLAKNQLSATPEDKASVLDGLKSLPAHADAGEAFQILAEANIRILALSNSAASATEELLKRAGLDDHVERIVSVEEVKLSKPRTEVYRHAATAAQVDPSQLALVATHPWDIHGAKAAGLIAAFVARGKPYPPVMLAPDLMGQSLAEVAQKLVGLS
jgi:2-haloacid dehalogenase